MGGPTIFVCNACLELCREIIREEEQHTPPEAHPDLACSFCGMTRCRQLVIGVGVYICDACVDQFTPA